MEGAHISNFSRLGVSYELNNSFYYSDQIDLKFTRSELMWHNCLHGFAGSVVCKDRLGRLRLIFMGLEHCSSDVYSLGSTVDTRFSSNRAESGEDVFVTRAYQDECEIYFI